MLKKRNQAGPQPEFNRVVNGIMKLKDLSIPPDLERLNFILGQAQQPGVKVVEQQWNGKELNEYFILKCSAPAREVPVWVFLSGSSTRMPSEKWRYPTGDMALVHNVIQCETTGASLSELISNSQEMRATSAHELASLIPSQQPAQFDSPSGVHRPYQPEAQAILQGDLLLVQLPTLLQSIRMSKMTGRLELRNNEGGSYIYFDEGKPVHAEFCGSVGDLAVIELLSWTSGQFRFHPGERTVERSIKNRLDALLMEGMTFADQSAFLEKQGLTLSAYLIRKRPDMRQKEFETTVSQGAPLDLKLAGNFYCQIDDTIQLLDLLRIMPLHKTEWVPILFNFLTQGIVVLADQPARSRKTVSLDDRGLDMSVADNAMRGCIRAETGIFTQGAMLYFMQNEFARLEAGGSPFALIIFEGQLKRAGVFDRLPESAVKEMITRVQSLIRPFEIFAHFELFDYALLLPQTELKTATLVAQRLVLSLRTIPSRDWESEYHFRCGVAGMPGDGKNVGTLVAAAQMAKQRAVESQSSVCMFRTLLS